MGHFCYTKPHDFVPYLEFISDVLANQSPRISSLLMFKVALFDAKFCRGVSVPGHLQGAQWGW